MPIGNILAELAVKIKVDAQPLQTGLNKADTSMGKFSTAIQKHSTAIKLALAGITSAIIGIGIKSVMTYTKMGDEIAKMAKRTGFSVKTLSELNYVAKRSGFELGSIEKAAKKMEKTIIDADRGLGTYVQSFEDLGLDIQRLRAMTPEEQFETICYALADLEDQTLKSALAQEIFGKSGTELFPMLDEGKEGIADLREEAHKLGNIYDDISATECEAFEDAIGDIKIALTGLTSTFAEEIVPGLTDFINKIVDVIKKIKEWNELHPGLIKKILEWAAYIGGGGIVFIAVWKFTSALKGLAIALGIVQAMSGPAGWATLGVSLLAAAGAVAALQKLFTGNWPGEEWLKGLGAWGKFPHEWLFEWELRERLKELEEGGLGTGGIITKPSLILAGEGGPEAIVPLGRGGFGDIIVNVQGSVVTERDLADSLRETFLKIKGRNTTVWE